MALNIEFEMEYLHFILSLAEANGDQERAVKIKKEIFDLQAKKEKKTVSKAKKLPTSRRELC